MMVMTLVKGSTASTYFGTSSGPRILPAVSLMHGGFHMELSLYTLALAVLATVGSDFVLGDIHMDSTSHVSGSF